MKQKDQKEIAQIQNQLRDKLATMAKTGIKFGDQAPHPLRSSSYSGKFTKSIKSSKGSDVVIEERQGFIDPNDIKMNEADQMNFTEFQLPHKVEKKQVLDASELSVSLRSF